MSVIFCTVTLRAISAEFMKPFREIRYGSDDAWLCRGRGNKVGFVVVLFACVGHMLPLTPRVLHKKL